MFTGQTIATIAPPHGQFFAGIVAAGDDRTFVLQAEVGGQTPNSPMPVNPSTAAFDELRLKADGHLESLSVLGAVPARTALSGFAISQDASRSPGRVALSIKPIDKVGNWPMVVSWVTASRS